MAQSGQYNYRRCLAHGETGAAQLACDELVRSTMHAVFLLNRAYMPFYKWAFRAMMLSLPAFALARASAMPLSTSSLCIFTLIKDWICSSVF